MAHTINQHEVESGGSSLSEKQFQILVDLLTPGYELSCMMLAEYKARKEAEDKSDTDSKPSS